jgi:hypothetical protein
MAARAGDSSYHRVRTERMILVFFRFGAITRQYFCPNLAVAFLHRWTPVICAVAREGLGEALRGERHLQNLRRRRERASLARAEVGRRTWPPWREHKLRPTPARQSSTLPMSEDGALPHGPSYRAHPRLYRLSRRDRGWPCLNSASVARPDAARRGASARRFHLRHFSPSAAPG